MTQIEEDEKFLKELEEDGSKEAKAQMHCYGTDSRASSKGKTWMQNKKQVSTDR